MSVPSKAGPGNSWPERRTRGLPATTLRSSLLGQPSVLTRRSLPASSLRSARTGSAAAAPSPEAAAGTWVRGTIAQGGTPARGAYYLGGETRFVTPAGTIRDALPSEVGDMTPAEARPVATEVVEARRSGAQARSAGTRAAAQARQAGAGARQGASAARRGDVAGARRAARDAGASGRQVVEEAQRGRGAAAGSYRPDRSATGRAADAGGRTARQTTQAARPGAQTRRPGTGGADLGDPFSAPRHPHAPRLPGGPVPGGVAGPLQGPSGRRAGSHPVAALVGAMLPIVVLVLLMIAFSA